MTQTSGAAFTADRPFFRYDLQTEAVEDGGQRFVDVTDPNGGESFRFFEVEYAVACGMDGERDLEGLVAWAKSELDLKTTTEELGAIVSKLDELRYLGDGRVAQAPASTAAKAPAKIAVEAPAKIAVEAPAPVQEEAAPLPEIAPPPPLAARATGIEVELGNSGKSPIASERPEQPAIAPDLELGHAGSATAGRPASSRLDDDMLLGAAGNEDSDFGNEEETIAGPSREVSTDLSQTFRIDKDEVQAAVRASKVMSAVEIPQDLEDELAAARAKTEEAKAPKEEAEAKPEAVPEVVPAAADISESIANEAAEADAGGDAIVLPEEPAKVAAAAAAAADASKAAGKPKAKGPRRNSASMVLWVILLLAAAGGAAYYYMEYVREQPEEKGPDVTPAKAAAVRKANVPEAPPKPPESSLVVGDAPSADVTSDRAGVSSWIIEPSSEVAEGDAIIKLSGFERAEKTIERHAKSQANYEAQLAVAKERNKPTIASLESNVARKKLDVELATTKLEALIIRAPIAGLVETLVEARRRIATGQVVANITGAPVATASFELPKGVTAAMGDEMEVVSKEDSELKATCTITEAAGQNVMLTCPADSGLSADAAVTLTLP